MILNSGPLAKSKAVVSFRVSRQDREWSGFSIPSLILLCTKNNLVICLEKYDFFFANNIKPKYNIYQIEAYKETSHLVPVSGPGDA